MSAFVSCLPIHFGLFSAFSCLYASHSSSQHAMDKVVSLPAGLNTSLPPSAHTRLHSEYICDTQPGSHCLYFGPCAPHWSTRNIGKKSCSMGVVFRYGYKGWTKARSKSTEFMAWWPVVANSVQGPLNHCKSLLVIIFPPLSTTPYKLVILGQPGPPTASNH